ncbi:MAG: ABC transporter permease, partial [Xanthobacteraceae bacterium]
MSLVSMTIVAEGTPAQERSAASRRARFIRPALGLVVPVTLALAWEIVVWLGWSSGRLAPPPSVIFQT